MPSAGMNRIRHAYREMVPGLEPYFVTSFHDDARGVLAAYGHVTSSDAVFSNIVHGLTTMIGMVATVVAMILGALAALVAVGLGAGVEGRTRGRRPRLPSRDGGLRDRRDASGS